MGTGLFLPVFFRLVLRGGFLNWFFIYRGRFVLREGVEAIFKIREG